VSVIRTAILLAAGEGSRLRGATPFKPLCPVGGVALIDHALAGLAAAGITRTVVVLGYGAEAIEAHLSARAAAPVETARSDPRWPNGVSVLAARSCVEAQGGGEVLLAMCDHLVDPALYARVAQAGAGDGLRLGVDRRLGHPWVDPLDVTCVATAGDRITAIGKGIEPHDCYDTGVFAIGARLFAALDTLPQPSLTEGVRLLASAGQARVVECSDLDWIDVDDPPALAQAERWLAAAPMAVQGVAAGR
jgi:1L-myo-inositol 1-phosphate cytidylyltransferase